MHRYLAHFILWVEMCLGTGIIAVIRFHGLGIIIIISLLRMRLAIMLLLGR